MVLGYLLVLMSMSMDDDTRRLAATNNVAGGICLGWFFVSLLNTNCTTEYFYPSTFV
jgi:hypothetical protein